VFNILNVTNNDGENGVVVGATTSGRGSERILELVEWLSTRHKPASLAEIVCCFGWPKSSTLLLLRTLVERAYVERHSDNRYQLIRLPGEASAHNSAWGTILRISESFLRDAVASANETGFIAVLAPERRLLYLNKILPDREIRYDRDITATRVPHHVASGLMLLAGMSRQDFDAYLALIDPISGDDIGEIRAAVEIARRKGYAVNLEGRVEGAAGVAAPIVDARGRSIAAINISGPRGRITQNLDRAVAAAVEAARRASEELERRIPTSGSELLEE